MARAHLHNSSWEFQEWTVDPDAVVNAARPYGPYEVVRTDRGVRIIDFEEEALLTAEVTDPAAGEWTLHGWALKWEEGRAIDRDTLRLALHTLESTSAPALHTTMPPNWQERDELTERVVPLVGTAHKTLRRTPPAGETVFWDLIEHVWTARWNADFAQASASVPGLTLEPDQGVFCTNPKEPTILIGSWFGHLLMFHAQDGRATLIVMKEPGTGLEVTPDNVWLSSCPIPVPDRYSSVREVMPALYQLTNAHPLLDEADGVRLCAHADVVSPE